MTALPTGIVTFLLTDIEGSTRLWELHPDAMGAVVARHDGLLTEAITRHGGVVIRTRGEGDSFFAVFDRATDAVAAAGDLQLALAAEPWSIPIRVRVGINTGEAELREGDYYGTSINRCARLRAIGHGGQTLVGQATAELAQGELPAHFALRPLGAHRLKDLQRPELVYQLLHPELPAEFPPLNSLEARPNNLPQQVTSFVGREREMAEVKRLLEGTRLLTLTGPGGTGKTRLAFQVGADLIDPFEHGVFFVDLAPITNPGLVLSAVAQTLGVREREGRPLSETLREHLNGKKLLLLLDNFEQVIGAAPIVAELLLTCAGLKILVTSRAVLHVRGEQEFPVPPLAVPDEARWALGAGHWVEGAPSAPVDPSRSETENTAPGPPLRGGAPQRPARLTEFAAVQLFVDRASAARPSFAISPENAAAVGEICRRLDGLPLAIELAAARIKVLSPQAMLARLEQRLPLLTGGARDLPERHQTLRGAIAWSYDLLAEPHRQLYRRLSVFIGGFTLTAAEAVCDLPNGGPPLDVLDGVGALVDNSMLRPLGETKGGDLRFGMLETIREFGAEELRAADEEAELRARHRDWYLAFAEEADRALESRAQGEWRERFDEEHDNLRAALDGTVERNEAEIGLRLGGALWRFWAARGHHTEGRARLADLLALPGEASAMARARALNGAGMLAHWQGDYAAARALCEESLAIRRSLNDQQGIADTLNNLGSIVMEQGDADAARALYRESLEIRRQLGDRRGIAISLESLGDVALDDGNAEAARTLYQESLEIRRALDDPPAVADSLNCLGIVAYTRGDLSAARALYEESLEIRRQLGMKRGIAASLANLGIIAHARGEYEAARQLYEESRLIQIELGDRPGLAVSLLHLGIVAMNQEQDDQARGLFRESIALFRELKNTVGVAECLSELAAGAAARGQPEQAAQLWGAAEALRDSVAAGPGPADPAEEARHAAVRDTLGADRFAACWAAGHALSIDEAIACGLSVMGASRTGERVTG
jgi:predicted ATPase/class 3 adenylate cyclase/Tfp pilus assembly protein PilF